MKTIKFVLVIFILMFTSSAFSQLKVDSSGRTIFGDNSRTYSDGISIEDNRVASYHIPFRIKRESNDNISLSRTNYKLVFSPYGTIALGNDIPTNPISSYIPIEVYANTYGGINLYLKNAASSSGYMSRVDATTAYPFVAYYNTTRTFYTKGDGTIWSSTTNTLSDVSLKSNIEKITNPLDKVLSLQGVTYDLNFATPDNEEKLSLEEAFKKEQMTTPQLTMDIFKQIQEEKKRKHIGVIAQEVEKVIPEVVRTREDGLKAVAYSEMIGLLIEAMKEQQGIIDELKLEVATLKGSSFRSSEETGSTTGMDALLSQCVLSQNAPNPFSVQTEIKYYLTDGIKSASICIFDMSGKMLETYPARQGQNSITIESSKLQAGMYLYSLIANGQVVDTKRMVLTK